MINRAKNVGIKSHFTTTPTTPPNASKVLQRDFFLQNKRPIETIVTLTEQNIENEKALVRFINSDHFSELCSEFYTIISMCNDDKKIDKKMIKEFTTVFIKNLLNNIKLGFEQRKLRDVFETVFNNLGRHKLNIYALRSILLNPYLESHLRECINVSDSLRENKELHDSMEKMSVTIYLFNKLLSNYFPGEHKLKNHFMSTIEIYVKQLKLIYKKTRNEKELQNLLQEEFYSDILFYVLFFMILICLVARIIENPELPIIDPQLTGVYVAMGLVLLYKCIHYFAKSIQSTKIAQISEEIENLQIEEIKFDGRFHKLQSESDIIKYLISFFKEHIAIPNIKIKFNYFNIDYGKGTFTTNPLGQLQGSQENASTQTPVDTGNSGPKIKTRKGASTLVENQISIQPKQTKHIHLIINERLVNGKYPSKNIFSDDENLIIVENRKDHSKYPIYWDGKFLDSYENIEEFKGIFLDGKEVTNLAGSSGIKPLNPPVYGFTHEIKLLSTRSRLYGFPVRYSNDEIGKGIMIIFCYFDKTGRLTNH